MAYITVGRENSESIDLYYEDQGNGSTVVLVHGYPLSGRSWEKQTSALLDAGYRVVTYDRRGFGESSKPATGYNYDTLAGDLDTILTKLDLHDVALFGFSMGGGEVARYLGRFGSRRVRMAGFISSITPFLLKTADNPHGVGRSVFDGLKAGIASDRYATVAAFTNNLYNSDVLKGSRVSEQVIQVSFNVGVSASPAATLQCVDAWLEDFRPDIARIDVPVLVVHGDQDRIVPIDSGGRCMEALIKSGTYEELPGAPHGCIWTHAAEVNRLMLEFIETAALGDRAMQLH